VKYKGVIYDCLEPAYNITDAVIAKKRISIDWIEDGEPGHLEATSSDGIHFRGNYGYPRPEPTYVFDL
jgi:hypothetical protein